jgi:hypothetical protein
MAPVLGLGPAEAPAFALALLGSASVGTCARAALRHVTVALVLSQGRSNSSTGSRLIARRIGS